MSFLLRKSSIQFGLKRIKGRRCLGTAIETSSLVLSALKNHQPVVALESTIITHGMPYPANLETALKVEELVRSQGAVPATIGILKGRVHVGLSQEQLEELAAMKQPCIKTSRRDLPYVLSQKLNGGTTVSGTMLVAHKAGIPIFVTGGIGGVHRGAGESFDVSADLTELGRTPVAVISSGVKSILDIGKTLEYLETQGVCVATLSPDEGAEFPAFFTRSSGFRSPYRVADPAQAARLIHHGLDGGGMLIAVPIPADQEADGRLIEEAIQSALARLGEGVSGKEVTPFLLAEVNRLTSGASLKANMALIQHNAAVGASIAVQLAQIRNGSTTFQEKARSISCRSSMQRDDWPRAVVVGGSIVDLVATVKEDSIRMDASTHGGSIRQSYGGVGRNLADGLSRLLTPPPLFVSAVGDDPAGRELIHHNSSMESRGIIRIPGQSTASYIVVLDHQGDFQFGIGDMDVHQKLTVDQVKQFEGDLTSARLVIMDGNLALSTIDYILDVCKSARVPVWYEPTDVHKAWKPFRSEEKWSAIAYTSPNLAELGRMIETIRQTDGSKPTGTPGSDKFATSIVDSCLPLLERMHCVMVTLGKHGMMIVRRGSKSESLPLAPWQHQADQEISWAHYPAPYVKQVVSVSGAGDCLAAGFIAGMLNGYDQDACADLGLKAAGCSVQHSPAVPSALSHLKLN